MDNIPPVGSQWSLPQLPGDSNLSPAQKGALQSLLNQLYDMMIEKKYDSGLISKMVAKITAIENSLSPGNVKNTLNQILDKLNDMQKHPNDHSYWGPDGNAAINLINKILGS